MMTILAVAYGLIAWFSVAVTMRAVPERLTLLSGFLITVLFIVASIPAAMVAHFTIRGGPMGTLGTSLLGSFFWFSLVAGLWSTYRHWKSEPVRRTIKQLKTERSDRMRGDTK